MSWPAAGGPAEDGWLPLFAVASVALIAGLQRAVAPAHGAVDRPARVARAISYGVYLFHWPVYTLVDERRLDVDRTVLFAARLAITLVVAATSYYVIEVPVRARRVHWRQVGSVAAGACLVVAGVVVVVPDRDGDLHLGRLRHTAGGGDRAVRSWRGPGTRGAAVAGPRRRRFHRGGDG